jgi:hypothetical protein
VKSQSVPIADLGNRLGARAFFEATYFLEKPLSLPGLMNSRTIASTFVSFHSAWIATPLQLQVIDHLGNVRPVAQPAPTVVKANDTGVLSV